MKPTISVVIPAHNEEKYVAGTIASIVSGCERLGVEYEVIVVNDDSSDKTKKVATKCGAKVIDVNLRNIGAVRNAGARVAQGDYLIFVDADTQVPEQTVAATFDALDRGYIGGGASVSLDNTKKISWYKYWIFPFALTIWQTLGGWAAGCYMFCTASAFSEIGGFPEEYYAAEEYFFSTKLKRLGEFVILDQPVVTSARKLHDYSLWQLLRFMIRPFFTFGGILKSRRGLEVLYEHKRDQ